MDWVIGKFVLETREDSNGDLFLHIAIELLANVSNPENLRHPL
jgi:hypothetical protein